MKMKRLLASVLALLLVVSILPIGALAVDIETGAKEEWVKNPIDNNRGTIDENVSTITNNGTLGGGPDSGTVNKNAGTITNNYGTVQSNASADESYHPTISHNHGLVVENNNLVENNKSTGKVTTNNGTVKTNAEGATVVTNGLNGTITNNSGTVGSYTDAENTKPNTDTGNKGTIGGNTGKVIVNDGLIVTNGLELKDDNTVKSVNTDATVELNNDQIGTNVGMVDTNSEEGYIFRNCGTVTTNEDGAEIYENSGTVSGNSGLIVINKATKQEFDMEQQKFVPVPGENGESVPAEVNNNSGVVSKNEGKVTNIEGGSVWENMGTVDNAAGGEVLANWGLVVNEEGGKLYDMIEDKTPGPNGRPINNFEEQLYTEEAGNYVGTKIERGNIETEDGKTEDFEDGGIIRIWKQAIQDTVLNLKEVGKLFKQDGYEVIGYSKVDYTQTSNPVVVYSTEYTASEGNWLSLVWGKIKTVIAPSAPSDEPEVKPVKAAAIPTTVAAEDVKVGTVVRVKGQIFKVIEMDDGSITVVTLGKLSKKDLVDLKAFLSKYLTPQQIELLLGEPELISEELAAKLFGGNTDHIVFKAAKNLFAE